MPTGMYVHTYPTFDTAQCRSVVITMKMRVFGAHFPEQRRRSNFHDATSCHWALARCSRPPALPSQE
eukprot:3850361-Amphidinium_carterae.2